MHYAEPPEHALPGRWSTWEEPMAQALTLAGQARAAGEVPVGALVLNQEGEILGQGFNAPISLKDPTAHAEIRAIRRAAKSAGNYRLPGSILVCTLEPCLMCLGAMIHARIDGLVYGARDPRTGAVVSRMQGNELPWTNHRFWVLGNILAEKSAAMLKEFFQCRRSAASGISFTER